jgi:adenylate cyclase
MSLEPDVCTAAIVRDELRRVLGSPNFATSDRNRRFLEYVIEETLAGRATRLKAYNIATTVFGRPDSFDPQLDPVVRMEAGRLRRALERFYLLERDAVSLRIAMPKGGYIPEFRQARSDEQHAGEETAPGIPSIFVTPFEPFGDPAALRNLNLGFTRQVVIALHQLGDCVICDRQPSAGRQTGHAMDVGKSDRLLTGDVALVGDVFSVTALLLDASTGRVLWGTTVQRPVPRAQCILALRDEVADHVAHALHEHLGERFGTAGECGAVSDATAPSEQSARPLITAFQHRGIVATH